ncbi:MAG: hypothetical protein QXH07_05170 [Thermoplasmata archaeon]
MKIGVYAFTFDDWKEKDYPLDLWIEWNCKLFDEVSLFYIGNKTKVLENINVQKYNNLTINGINGIKSNIVDIYGNKMYAYFKELAQNFLFTDWKFLLDIDEFVVSRPTIDLNNINDVYGIYVHLPFGDINHEISPLGDSPAKIGNVNLSRLAYGMSKVIGDGAMIDKNINTNAPIHIYHTTLLRNGVELANRTWLWKKNIVVDPNKYKEYWANMELLYVDDEKLPDILRNNKQRFQYFKKGDI